MKLFGQENFFISFFYAKSALLVFYFHIIKFTSHNFIYNRRFHTLLLNIQKFTLEFLSFPQLSGNNHLTI